MPEEGNGWGYQIDGFLSYHVNKALSVGLGGRYWYMQSRGLTRFDGHVVDMFATPQVVRWKTENVGVFLQSSLKIGPSQDFGRD